jgi:hypothetical protein
VCVRCFGCVRGVAPAVALAAALCWLRACSMAILNPSFV